MEGVNDASIGQIPKVVGLGMRCIADENARGGTLEEFGIICGDKRIGTAANFAKMGKGGRLAVPEFIRSPPVNGCGCSEAGEVGSSGTEFIPEVGGCIAGEVHCTSFVKEGAVELLSTAILGRSVGSSELVIDAVQGTPF